MQLLALFIAVLASLALGCSSSSKPKGDHSKHLSGTDEQIFIGDTIEKNYDPNVIIKRAESFFDKEDYPEAVIEYTHFLELHRIHTLAPYAQYRLGESFLRMVKSVDRDPEPIARAQDAFEKLLKEYPGSRYEAEARQKIFECQDLMAQAYLFVGHFYYRRDSFLAAAYRFESVVTRYPDMKAAPEALYYLALSYKELGGDDWAQEKLTLLAERYPGNSFAGAGRSLLAQLNLKRPPQTMVAMSEPVSNGANGSNGHQADDSSRGLMTAPALSEGQTTAVSTAPAIFTNQSGATLTSGTTTLVSGATTPPGSALIPQAMVCRLGSWC
jgi:outer membrane protein assembly factor BamD